MVSEAVSVVDCRPGDSNLTLKLKVVDSKSIVEGKKNVTECLVGDSSACILFTAKGDQCAQLKAGECVLIKGAKVDMYKGSMRLVASPDESSIETTSDSISVAKDNNMSLIEFETVIVGATPNPPKAGDPSGGAEVDDGITEE